MVEFIGYNMIAKISLVIQIFMANETSSRNDTVFIGVYFCCKYNE